MIFILHVYTVNHVVLYDYIIDIKKKEKPPLPFLSLDTDINPSEDLTCYETLLSRLNFPGHPRCTPSYGGYDGEWIWLTFWRGKRTLLKVADKFNKKNDEQWGKEAGESALDISAGSDAWWMGQISACLIASDAQLTVSGCFVAARGLWCEAHHCTSDLFIYPVTYEFDWFIKILDLRCSAGHW